MAKSFLKLIGLLLFSVSNVVEVSIGCSVSPFPSRYLGTKDQQSTPSDYEPPSAPVKLHTHSHGLAQKRELHGVHGNSNVPQWKLILNKFGILVVFLIVASIGIVLPYLPGKHKALRASRPYINSFACGAFLGLAFFHLLPEGLEATEDAKLGYYVGSSWYNLLYLIAFLGFMLILVLEKVILCSEAAKSHARLAACCQEAGRKEDGHENDSCCSKELSLQSKDSNKHTTVPTAAALATLEPERASEKDGYAPGLVTESSSDEETVCCPESHTAQTDNHCHHHETVECVGDFSCCLGSDAEEEEPVVKRKRNAAGRVQSFSKKDLIAETEEKQIFKSNSIKNHEHDKLPQYGIVALLTTLSLSVHSVFEGIVVGMSAELSACWLTALSIIGHKWAAGIALGASCASKGLTFRMALPYLGLFVIASPLGIIIGILIATTNEMTVAVLNSLSLGTIFYVATDLTFHHFGKSSSVGEEVGKLSVAVLGAGFIYGLMMLHIGLESVVGGD